MLLLTTLDTHPAHIDQQKTLRMGTGSNPPQTKQNTTQQRPIATYPISAFHSNLLFKLFQYN
jgi:hypothetical protein